MAGTAVADGRHPRPLAQRFGVKPDGWERYLPDWSNICEIEMPEDGGELKDRKKAREAAQKP